MCDNCIIDNENVKLEAEMTSDRLDAIARILDAIAQHIANTGDTHTGNALYFIAQLVDKEADITRHITNNW